MTEAELQQTVTDALTIGGWVWQHQRPARTSRGWRTAIEGRAGFPDLIALRGGRLLVLELKSGRGRLTPDQAAWLHEFRAAGIDARVIRPADLDALIAEITSGRVA